MTGDSNAEETTVSTSDVTVAENTEATRNEDGDAFLNSTEIAICISMVACVLLLVLFMVRRRSRGKAARVTEEQGTAVVERTEEDLIDAAVTVGMDVLQ